METPVELKFNEETSSYQAGYEVMTVEYKDVSEEELKVSFKELQEKEEEQVNNIAELKLKLEEAEGDLEETRHHINLYSKVEERLFPEEEVEKATTDNYL